MDEGLGIEISNETGNDGDPLQASVETLMVYFPYNATLGCPVVMLIAKLSYRLFLSQTVHTVCTLYVPTPCTV